MTDRTLIVDNLAVRFGPAMILESVSLTVGPGMIAGLIGMNGAGKTTTLRAISGVVRRAGGEILFHSKPLSNRAESVAEAGVVHVPEGRRLFASMTVQNNLLVVGSGPRSERLERIAQVAEVLPRIKPKMQEKAGNLSGGEQQLVALARGLVAAPSILLIDEMSLGLSPAALDNVVQVLRHIAHERQIGILLVDQNAAVISKYCEDIYELHNGRSSLVVA